MMFEEFRFRELIMSNFFFRFRFVAITTLVGVQWSSSAVALNFEPPGQATQSQTQTEDPHKDFEDCVRQCRRVEEETLEACLNDELNPDPKVHSTEAENRFIRACVARFEDCFAKTPHEPDPNKRPNSFVQQFAPCSLIKTQSFVRKLWTDWPAMCAEILRREKKKHTADGGTDISAPCVTVAKEAYTVCIVDECKGDSCKFLKAAMAKTFCGNKKISPYYPED